MTWLLDYIFPHRCVNCARVLQHGTLPVCQRCFHSLPFTYWKMGQNNPTFHAIYEHADILGATSLLAYQHNNMVKKLIMANKYYNQRRIGNFLSELSTHVLGNHRFDVITYIPSHPKTVRLRGYNQVKLYATCLSEQLNIPLDNAIVRRIKRLDSQTHKNKEERYKSLHKAFQVSDKLQPHRRLLLVDDVLTTGATLSSCCNSILGKEPTTAVYVLTMAKVI